jgi:RDD family
MLGATSRARRLVARGIDDGVVLAIQVAFVVPAVVLRAAADDAGRNEPQILLVTGWLVSVCYEVASTHLGGGPGKRALQLRVVTEASAVLPVRASIARWALVTGVQPLVWAAVGVFLTDSAPIRVACGALVAVSLLWRAGLAATVVRGDGTAGWHDRRVGSRVTPPRPDEVGTTDDLPDVTDDDLPTATVTR